MPGSDDYFFVVGHAEAGNHLKRSLRKISTAQKADKAGKVLLATDNDMTEIAVHAADHYVRSSKMTTMIDPSSFKYRTEKRFQSSGDGRSNGCR